MSFNLIPDWVMIFFWCGMMFLAFPYFIAIKERHNRRKSFKPDVNSDLKGTEPTVDPRTLPNKRYFTEIEFVPDKSVPKGEVWCIDSSTGELVAVIKNIKS